MKELLQELNQNIFSYYLRDKSPDDTKRWIRTLITPKIIEQEKNFSYTKILSLNIFLDNEWEVLVDNFGIDHDVLKRRILEMPDKQFIINEAADFLLEYSKWITAENPDIYDDEVMDSLKAIVRTYPNLFFMFKDIDLNLIEYHELTGMFEFDDRILSRIIEKLNIDTVKNNIDIKFSSDDYRLYIYFKLYQSDEEVIKNISARLTTKITTAKKQHAKTIEENRNKVEAAKLILSKLDKNQINDIISSLNKAVEPQ